MTRERLVDFIYDKYIRDRHAAEAIADEALAKGGNPEQLRVIAGNCAINYTRLNPQPRQPSPMPDDFAAYLPPELREVIRLTYFEHLTEREAAERLNISRHELRNRQSKARALVRRDMLATVADGAGI